MSLWLERNHFNKIKEIWPPIKDDNNVVQLDVKSKEDLDNDDYWDKQKEASSDDEE
jgi:hypothetical protein